MRIDEYLDKVCGEIMWKDARKPVREEMRSHILERAEEYRAMGDAAEQAEEKAVANMGDGVQTGRELNRLHKPRYDWVLIGALAGLLGLGVLHTATADYQAGYNNWYIITIAGLASIFLLAFIDIRKIVIKKPVYLSLYFGSVFLIVVQFITENYLQAGSFHLQRFPFFSPIIMIFSAGVWIKNIKTPLGMVSFLLSALVGGIALFLMPTFTLSITFMVCVWAMLWVVKAKRWNFIFASLTSALVLVFLFYFFVYDTHWLGRIERAFQETTGAGFILWQVKLKVVNLNWFGPGSIVPDIGANYTNMNEYALLNFMWKYGLVAGLAVISLCGVVLWRVCRILLSIRDVLGRTVSIGLCTYITVQICWNVLMNLGVVPSFGSTFLPMFSQVWSQSLVLGSALGILISLYRKKDIYSALTSDAHAEAPADTNLTA